MGDILEAMRVELQSRRSYTGNERIETVYFGGGTPSLLPVKGLNNLLRGVRMLFPLSDKAEITLEANPDDLDNEYLKKITDIGINRISLGVQSFNDCEVRLMNRRHDTKEAKRAIELLSNAGLKTYSIDLIYGIPGSDIHSWSSNLSYIKEYHIPHFSAYHLGYENGTILYYRKMKRQISPLQEEESLSQYRLLTEFSNREGYEHYEISNFSLPGHMSIHNSNYWSGRTYLGIGPAAHSYNGKTRSWNIASNYRYLQAIRNDEPYRTEEVLSETDRYNEMVMISFRTRNGLDIDILRDTFGEFYTRHFEKNCQPYIEKDYILRSGSRYFLSEPAMMISDRIIADLFVTDGFSKDE